MIDKKNFVYRTLWLLFSLLLLLTFGCQPQPILEPSLTPKPQEPVPTPSPTMGTLTYTNSEHGFSVEYPEDWNCVESGLPEGEIVAFIGPIVPLAETEFTINIGISSWELQPPIPTLEEWYRANQMYMMEVAEDYENLDEYSTIISGLRAIVSTNTRSQYGYKIMGSLAGLLKEKRCYIITYMTPPEFYNDYVDCFELMISSFKFE